MNYSGFCFAQMRYLSDEEKIRSVFDYQNARSELPINFKYYEHIKYESFDEYIKENPDCCKINSKRGHDVPVPWFLDRIFGFNSGDFIFIDFKMRYVDEKGKQRIKTLNFENAVQNCGKVRW
ncbi:MAG: hypothetical protein QNJ63_03375 [Calothrix sp. MO_192.B10]|nr:hypothetical protein [Calothrix sp. MO_192.B10]